MAVEAYGAGEVARALAIKLTVAILDVQALDVGELGAEIDVLQKHDVGSKKWNGIRWLRGASARQKKRAADVA